MNQTVSEKILGISDWMHPYRLEDGQEVQLSKPWYADWHRWRIRTEMSGLEAVLGGDVTGKRVLDVACNDGFYGFEMARRGASQVTGLDARDDALDRARMLREHFGYDNINFVKADVQRCDLLELFPAPFDVVLFCGILYHLSDPIETVRAAGEITGKVLSIQTFIIGSDQPILKLHDENVSKPGSGTQPIATFPSQAAVYWMLQYAGFDLVVRTCPPYFSSPATKTRHHADHHFAFFHGIKADEDDRSRLLRDSKIKRSYDPDSSETQVVVLDKSTPPLTPHFQEYRDDRPRNIARAILPPVIYRCLFRRS